MKPDQSQGHAVSEMRLDHLSIQRLLGHILESANQIILGKDAQIRLALSCVLSGGHLLIEDLPGVGKTTLSHLIAQLLGLEYKRIQFTSDLLPADVIGASIYDKNEGSFHFQPGPIFTQVLLADEINRSTPKAQSSLLEGMEERQVTVDGVTRKLPEPFFVIATQNPHYHIGTFPLPESQLDRFMMCIELGYPTHEAEREIYKGKDRRQMIPDLKSTLSAEQIISIQKTIDQVHVSDALFDYLQAIIEYTRSRPDFGYGLSPRGGLALLKGARAWAYLDGRMHVLPEDIQAVLPSVIFHRLRQQSDDSEARHDKADDIIQNVPIP